MSKKKEEIAKEVIEETAPEVVEEPATAKVDIDAFIARKLKVINELPNKAKAKTLAERLMRHKEVR